MKNNKKKKIQIEKEKSIIQIIVNTTKFCFFQSLYLCLKEEEVQPVIITTFTIINFVQLLYFSFHEFFLESWSANDLSKSMNDFTGYLFWNTYIKDYNTFLTVFYLQVGSLLLLIGNMGYCAYASIKKLPYLYNILIIRYVLVGISTFLYLPYLNQFANIFYCFEGNLKNYESIECWAGMHFFHAFVGFISLFLFLWMILKIQLTYFEGGSASKDISAKISGKYNSEFSMYQFLVIILFTIMNDEKFSFIILLLMFGGSIVIFLRFHFNSPYYNYNFSKLWGILTGLLLWTQLCLCVAKLAENTYINGIFTVWFIGFPFIIMILITQRDSKLDNLLQNINKFANGEELMFQVRYLQRLITQYNYSQNFATVLDGYIEVHKKNCSLDNCPIKEQNDAKSNRILKIIMKNSDNTLKPKHARLIFKIFTMYQVGTKKFPNNTNLRISYAYFLMEKMKYKQQALSELSHAEENSPPFDLQFVIYKLKKIIEEDIQKERKQLVGQKKDDKPLDIISQMRFEKLEQALKQDIELSTMYHMEFWSTLQEDSPDIRKLNDQSYKIYKIVKQTEECWEKLMSISQNIAKPLILFSHYQEEIIHDLQRAKQIMDQANALIYKTNKQKGNGKLDEIAENDDYESKPSVTISLESDQIGMIQQANLSLCSMLGYTRNELVNMKINQLMPIIFSFHHDDWLERFLEHQNLDFVNQQDRIMFSMKKNGYIYPFVLKVKSKETLLQGLQLVGTFQKDTAQKNIAHFLINNDGMIEAMSETCISVLNVDQKAVQICNYEITKLFPQILMQQEDYIGKQFQKIKFKPCGPAQYIQGLRKQYKYEYRCGMQNLILQNGDKLGFHVKIEKIILRKYLQSNQDELDEDEEEQVLNVKQLYLNDQRRYKMNQIKFFFGVVEPNPLPTSQYFKTTIKYVGEHILVDEDLDTCTIADDSLANISVASINTQNQKSQGKGKNLEVKEDKYKIYLSKERRQQLKEKELNQELKNNGDSQRSKLAQSAKQKMKLNIGKLKDKKGNFNNINNEQQQNNKWELIDYGVNIRTVRLVVDKFINAQDLDDSDQNEDLENQDESIFQQEDINNLGGDVKMSHNFNDILKNKQAINSLINYELEPRPITRLTWLIKFLLFTLFVISITEFIIVRIEFDDITKGFNLIQQSNNKNANLQAIQADIRDLRLLNLGLKNYMSEAQKSAFYTETIDEINLLLDEIDEIKSYLYNNNNLDTQKHLDLQEKNEIKLYYNLADFEEHGLNTGTEKIVSRIHRIKSSNLETYVWNDEGIFFVEYNLFNEFFLKLQDSTNLYVTQLLDMARNQIDFLLSLLIVVTLLIIISNLIVYPVLLRVSKSNEKVLQLFLEIKTKIVNKLYTQSETFIFQLRQDDEDQGSIGDQEKMQENQKDESKSVETGLIKQRKKKRFINKIQTGTNMIFINFVLGILILEIYFIYNFISSDSILSQVQSIIIEFNQTQWAETYYGLVDNIERQLFQNQDQQILLQQPFQVLLDSIEQMYILDSDILKEHSQNLDLLSQNYKDEFNSIMALNPCELFLKNNYIQNIGECESFADKTVKSGMSVALTRYFENIRKLLNYYNFIQNGEMTFQEISQEQIDLQIVTNDIKQDSILNLMNLKESDEIREMQRVYIKNAFRYLNKKFILNVEDSFENQNTQRLFFLMTFFVLIFIMYGVFWQPTVFKLNRNIWESRSLLTIIPHDVIITLKGVRKYLRQLYEDINKSKTKEQQIEDSKQLKQDLIQNTDNQITV